MSITTTINNNHQMTGPISITLPTSTITLHYSVGCEQNTMTINNNHQMNGSMTITLPVSTITLRYDVGYQQNTIIIENNHPMSGPISIILPGSTIILQFCVGYQQNNRLNLPCAYCGQYNLPQVNDIRDVMNNQKEDVIYIKEENIKIGEDIHTEEKVEDEEEVDDEEDDEEDEEDDEDDEDDEEDEEDEDDHAYLDHDYRDNFDWEMSEYILHEDPNLYQEMFLPVSNTVSENEADNELSFPEDEDSGAFDTYNCNAISEIVQFLKKDITLV